ncbi:MAG: N4-gp56 family major capsid protein [Ruminococcaceae bacterium]|nr:N4-gp56 family major capsid protein [Oscillospiraceae bacterium]
MENTNTYGANSTVHSTEGFVNSNAGTVENYNGGGLSAEMKTFYDKTLIELATPNLVHAQFGQKRSIPAHGGKTIEFRRMKPLAKNTNAITEGITPSGSKMTVVPLTATLNQYGDYIEQTDLIEMTSIDNTVIEATKLLADQAGRTLDTVIRDVLQTGTNVYYCPNDDEGYLTDVSSRAYLEPSSRLRVVDVFKAAAQLKALNVPTIDGKYVAIIHPHVAFDLMQQSGDAWIDIKKYADPDNILNGELGTLGGVRFVESSEAKINYGKPFSSTKKHISAQAYTNEGTGTVSAGCGTATPFQFTVKDEFSPDIVGRLVQVFKSSTNKASVHKITGVNVENKFIFLDSDCGTSNADSASLFAGEGGSLGCATYSTLFLGRDAYGIIDINGSGTIEHIVKQRGYGNDPLNQRSSIGWKAFMTAAILADEYILRVESSSSFADSISEGN